MSKTRVNNPPPSVKELIIRHSKARVLVASAKPFVTGHNPLTKLPEFSRPIHKLDVIESLVKKYA